MVLKVHIQKPCDKPSEKKEVKEINNLIKNYLEHLSTLGGR